jgi:hypothetical protein
LTTSGDPKISVLFFFWYLLIDSFCFFIHVLQSILWIHTSFEIQNITLTDWLKLKMKMKID